MRLRNLRPLAVAASAALVLAACSDGDSADDGTAPDGAEQTETEQPEAEGELEELDELDDEALEDLLAQQDEDPLGDLPDPNDDITDGIYRGSGVIVPIPEDWTLDTASFAQGAIVATPEDVSQQFFVQAVDTDTLPEEVTFEEIIDGNLEQAGQEPTVNEDVELEGAEQARLLRFEELPSQVEGEPDNSILLVVADDGDGRLGIFNYAAASDDFDEATAELLLDGAGFDAASDPASPAPTPAP